MDWARVEDVLYSICFIPDKLRDYSERCQKMHEIGKPQRHTDKAIEYRNFTTDAKIQTSVGKYRKQAQNCRRSFK
ncbi:hypothetical protein Ciccas_012283 [Cichlidogyrus casuarinus]|uniref:Uncharacterized protein n=1 Tax=Cichlidogyrus casuarinus TaxID=1844966 RepID=A0ABD2PPA7_9PLAT